MPVGGDEVRPGSEDSCEGHHNIYVFTNLQNMGYLWAVLLLRLRAERTVARSMRCFVEAFAM